MASESQNQLRELLNTGQPPELGPAPRKGILSVAEINAAVSGAPEQSRELIRALALLWHDHLDESHRISQGIENPDGSFLHAIMHRREPDFWNSKYWWRRVGNHAAFPEIAARVGKLLKERAEDSLAKKLLPGGKWDAFAFVDACEAARPDDALLREIQGIESEVLLERFIAL